MFLTPAAFDHVPQHSGILSINWIRHGKQLLRVFKE